MGEKGRIGASAEGDDDSPQLPQPPLQRMERHVERRRVRRRADIDVTSSYLAARRTLIGGHPPILLHDQTFRGMHSMVRPQ